MSLAVGEGAGAAAPSDPVDPRAYASAVLNILDDSALEKARLIDTQRAVFSLLQDIADEKDRLEATQKAVLNVLDDAAWEKSHLIDTQRAMFNLLDDVASEKARLEIAQKAILNILEDFDLEKKKVESANIELRGEIAERRMAEEALRKSKTEAEAVSKELEAFSYSVAHDLRAPLRAVDGFSQALLKDYGECFDARGRTYLQYVRESAQQMGQLIDALLSLSRVSRGEMRRERVDLSDLARKIMAKFRQAQPERQVELVVEEGLTARVDRRLLEVALSNLLDNAWKFTGKRAAARIEFGARAGVRPRVYFVRDNGAGFDARYVDKLFGVFQRLHSTQDFEGTGIGLATVYRIVRRHGGRVWAEGEVNRGATFYFTLEEGNR
ncbi:MAG: hypothetical protein HYV18_01845 [Gammaproteobacteria bacterium]|nr:hypothetical protein [Gammaproteobacteria bacterium]